MAQIIPDILNGFKSFVAQFEKVGRDVVAEIEQKAPAFAQQIIILLKAVIADIKNRIAQLIRLAKAKWNAMARKRADTNLGQSTSGFSQKLRAKAQEVERRAEAIMQEIRSAVTTTLQEARNTFHRLTDGMKTAAGDVGGHIKTAGQDMYRELVTIGHNAIAKTKSFVESSFNSIEVDGSFAFKHALQIGEGAVLTAVNPVVIGGLALSTAIFVISHNYAQKLEMEDDDF